MSGFDRLRPRTPDASSAPLTEHDSPPDGTGRRALFSSAEGPSRPGPGSVGVECSSCGERTVLSAGQALRQAVPSLHLPLLRRDHPSWMRCPACGRRTWVRLTLHL